MIEIPRRCGTSPVRVALAGDSCFCTVGTVKRVAWYCPDRWSQSDEFHSSSTIVAPAGWV